jgi:hypothetical protein
MSNALRATLAAARESKPEPPATEDAGTKSAARPARQAKVQPPTRTTGKSSNPDFESVKLYVRKQTRRAAERKWQDDTGGDLSELVEQLLIKYLGA